MSEMRVVQKRDELMRRKLEIDSKLAEANILLDEAKATAAAEGKFLPPKEYAALRRNREFLARESQRLQFELRGDRKQHHDIKDEKGHLFLQEFFMLAKQTLDHEVFKEICKDAEANLTAAAKLKAPS